MQLARTTAPAVAPVSMPEAKAHLRVLHTSEDALIGRIVAAATEHVEKTVGHAFITQGWSLWLPAFPACGIIELPRPPLVEVSEIVYRDTAGAEQTLDAATYTVCPHGLKGWIQRRAWKSWPTTEPGPMAVEVRYTAGYGNEPDKVPESARHAILLLVSHFYANRDETNDKPLSINPVAAERLLAPFRTHGWI